MEKNRQDELEFRRIADKYGIDITEVRRAVHSFFAIIEKEARRLPFDNPQRIYTKDKFEEYAAVRNIPYIGRIGPAYSKYLKWRANEAKNIAMAARSNYRSRLTQGDIDYIAGEILAGRTPPPFRKRKGNEMYNRVWLIGKDGKRLAYQVIPKENEDGKF